MRTASRRWRSLALACLLIPAAAAGPPGPQEPTDLVVALIRLRTPSMEFIASRPTIVAAVAAQNARQTSQKEIDEIDRVWQSTPELTDFKKSLQENDAGRILKSFMVRGSKTYTEALLTDRHGALVAAYPTPSDYWQGDEAKFQVPWETGELYIGPIEFDESTQAYASQVSVLVVDDAGQKIGVLIMGVRLSKGPPEPADAD
jgi:hypothetical protein